MTQIRTGDTEVITAKLFSFVGQPLTGKADITALVRRDSDGLVYDWSDGTFKALGDAVEPRRVMTESNPTDFPGEYQISFTAPEVPDVYAVTVDQTPWTDALNVPQCGDIRAGGFADTIELNRKLLNNRQALADGFVNNLVTYDDDDITAVATASVTDVNGNPIVLEAGVPARRTRGV